jgi:hypothetical protein
MTVCLPVCRFECLTACLHDAGRFQATTCLAWHGVLLPEEDLLPSEHDLKYDLNHIQETLAASLAACHGIAHPPGSRQLAAPWDSEECGFRLRLCFLVSTNDWPETHDWRVAQRHAVSPQGPNLPCSVINDIRAGCQASGFTT